MGRKELVLLVASTLLTLLVAVALIRWLAPGLLGGPRDLELVRSSREVPPFFEGVFREEHFRTQDFLLRDPRTLNRARPFHGEVPGLALGPHDVLGFRNRGVPAVADVVVIGDSQTYGVNVLLEDNWPSAMARALPGRSTYSMAVGSWGAVQYADMSANAAAFRPRVVVVALYTGNDALDSFGLAYGSDDWSALRPDPRLSAADAPSVTFPPPASEVWTTALGGRAFGFTPKLRLLGNGAHPAAEAGYGVMRKALEAMARIAQGSGFRLAVTVIPTKELVHAPRLAAEGIEAPADYRTLVESEQRRARDLCDYAARLPSGHCIDVIGPLQAAALQRLDLYPEGADGHPLAGGYAVIGATVAEAIAGLLPPQPAGWVALADPATGAIAMVYLVRDGIAWFFPSDQLIRAAGWARVAPRPVSPRDLAGLSKRTVTQADLRRLGPKAER